MLREFGFTVYTDAITSVSERGKELKAKIFDPALKSRPM